MELSPELGWQPSLFEIDTEADFDETFSTLSRIDLDSESWLEYQPGWVRGADSLFDSLLENFKWEQRSRHLYETKVVEPRLTSSWSLSAAEPLEPPVLERMRKALSNRYGVEFDSVGLNLYRDGRASVAWHRDKIPKEIEDPIVILVSVGEPRKFLVRRHGGGPSKGFRLGRGDLLVGGGKFQRAWEHTVPKVASAGPRISIAFRYGMTYVD